MSLKGNHGPLFVVESTIEGNLEVEDNEFEGGPAGVKALILGNPVGGNLSFDANRGGPTDISGNTIAGNLSCNDNEQAPTGSGNAADDKEGQCSSL